MRIRTFGYSFIVAALFLCMVGLFLLPILNYYSGIDLGLLLRCTNGGGSLFFWQILSRHLLIALSIVLNILFFSSRKNRTNKMAYGKIKLSTMVIGIIILSIGIWYFTDSIVNYDIFCGHPKGGWLLIYFMSYVEAITLHFNIFFWIFILFDIKYRVKINS